MAGNEGTKGHVYSGEMVTVKIIAENRGSAFLNILTNTDCNVIHELLHRLLLL
ncbi:hypothetical protein MA16_Dca001056 [Dendrobium catenatum]|uniref:TRAM domain-containing protein n=1 Tax=Dendrobium catenatum TaxID=906689 RepID=A0A2I0WLB9_9ASPA|nr:hypothetical protein MA16_Dca001056 [Dendrobium catenatum]